MREQYSAYTIHKIADEQGYVVCRLPPYHCEFNPMELVSSLEKRDAAKHNVRYKKNLMEGFINGGVSRAAISQWKNY